MTLQHATGLGINPDIDRKLEARLAARVYQGPAAAGCRLILISQFRFSLQPPAALARSNCG
jgi:hypothetical protein